jgi:outer membrane receptor protein involved in Fe transport
MSLHLGRSWLLMGMVWTLYGAAPSAAQSAQPPDEGPYFLAVAWPPEGPQDVTAAPVLQRRVSISAADKTVGAALKQVIRQADLEILYSAQIVPLRHPLKIEARDITVANALSRILAGLTVDVSVTPTGALALLPRGSTRDWTAPDSGGVNGRVSDSRDGSPLAGASVNVERTQLTTLTDEDGRYSLSGLPSGVYTVRARYIGFAPGRREVTVVPGKDVALDFALEPSAQELEQVVVTGTIVPTEVKALPNPVTVIDEAEIAALRPQTVVEVFRQAVPGAVGWNYSSSPYNTPFSVRGATGLSAVAPSMKVFIDGVQAAASGFNPVDPNSIARMEVIRGPQAATIYGSDAIGGVVQIFTKRGDPALEGPRVSGEAALGVAQHPYAGHEGVLRHEYQASVRGGASGIGYHLGAGYSRAGDWLPAGELSGEAKPSVHGGANFARGALGLDISGRYYAYQGGNNLFNPALLESGFAPFSRPSLQAIETQNQTFGVRATVTPMPWSRTEVTAGIDRYSFDIAQERPRLTTPADTLLLVSDHADTRRSLGITSSAQKALTASIRGSVTIGADYWVRTVSDWFAFNAANTTGAISTGSGGAISATRIETTNGGYFVQTQVGFKDAVFLTAGVRAESNSDFGDSLGTPILPRAGLTLVQSVRATTIKLRGSWGRAIRAPSPGRKLGFTSPTAIQLPNPRLGPERQQGWDVGLDLVFGEHGVLSLTYFRQVADHLADGVVLETTPVLTQQFQNVGRVNNSGVEVEAGLAAGPFSVRGQYGYVRTRIRQLSPTYAGDLRVGDVPLLNPAHTAGASISFSPSPEWTATGGVTYVGRWRNYDYVALFRCQGGSEPCRADFRDYQTSYPALLKLNLGVTRQFTTAVAGFTAIDNLTNNNLHEANNLLPVRGRTTTVGLRFQH